MFKAIVIEQVNDKQQVTLKTLEESQLPSGDTDIDVYASTINYKDALAITGKAPVVRTFPMIPGIDLVGQVKQSTGPFKAGDMVLLNGFGVGEKHWGGLAEKARLNSDWLIRLPSAFTPLQAMTIGTAGYTAMLCVMALEKHGTDYSGEVLVTGASGGVGSFAVKILSTLGYRVVAATGKQSEADYLTQLGAQDIIERSSIADAGKPLQKERWSGAIDCVGSHSLENICASLKYGSAVAACGLAQGMDFAPTVAPFILRGITLYGIDSVMQPITVRQQAWDRLAGIVDAETLNSISQCIELEQVIERAYDVLGGQIRGKLVVDITR